jgi:hypothetical protein
VGRTYHEQNNRKSAQSMGSGKVSGKIAEEDDLGDGTVTAIVNESGNK